MPRVTFKQPASVITGRVRLNTGRVQLKKPSATPAKSRPLASARMDELRAQAYEGHLRLCMNSFKDPVRLQKWFQKTRKEASRPLDDLGPITVEQIEDVLCLDYMKKGVGRYEEHFASFYNPSLKTAFDIPRAYLEDETTLVNWFCDHHPHIALLWQRFRPEAFP